MKKITTSQDLIQAIAFIKTNDPNNLSYKEDLLLLPEHIQEIVKANIGILPKHVTTELFKELLINSLKNLNPKYQIDPESESIIDSISMFFSNDEAFLKDDSCSFTKGILLMGRVGCGKTALIKGISNLMEHFLFKHSSYHGPQSLRFTTLNSYLFTEAFSKEGYKIFDQGLFYKGSMVSFLGPRLIIDDLGVEDVCTHFGTSTNVIGDVILRRYDNNQVTFGTTNLDPKKLKAFYGDRVYSRMLEMMNFLIYEGNDRRH